MSNQGSFPRLINDRAESRPTGIHEKFPFLSLSTHMTSATFIEITYILGVHLIYYQSFNKIALFYKQFI